MRRFVLLALLSATTLRAPAAAQTTPALTASLRIAAASDLRFALDEALVGFRSMYPSVQIEATYGSSGSFFAQIREGAPFDVFLSGDADYAERLSNEGLGEPPFAYAIGRLVLAVRKDSGFDPRGFAELLKGPGIRRLAIANPAHAPYGRAAVATLRSWKIYDAVAPRLVFGESVSQAAQYVDAGAAQAGLIALALTRVKDSKLVFAEIPEGI
ncbi:MAG: molybdate ABC transporter substrate-binding protein, partial [Vicinamibacteria bacterium]|nr:molybdate ABC transporter substrate-binding protein [Vicinamibacteria bacterium]